MVHGKRQPEDKINETDKSELEENPAMKAEGMDGDGALSGESEAAAGEVPENEKTLAKELAEIIQQRDEYLDMAQRIQAEFENFRRRNNTVRSEAWEDGARETIALMLPVVDNLERALEAEKEKTPLRDGVELVLKQMLDVLEKRGVTVINRLGEPFDPEMENAVMQADASEGEPGSVCTVLQKGYRTQNRVIRYAMVRVVAAD